MGVFASFENSLEEVLLALNDRLNKPLILSVNRNDFPSFRGINRNLVPDATPYSFLAYLSSSRKELLFALLAIGLNSLSIVIIKTYNACPAYGVSTAPRRSISRK